MEADRRRTLPIDPVPSSAGATDRRHDPHPAGWSLVRSIHRLRNRPPLPDAVYRALVDMLFNMTLPTIGMGAAITLVATLFALDWHDSVAGGIAALTVLVTIARLLTFSAYRRRSAAAIPIAELKRWELLYALGSYAAALLLGALNGRALIYHYPMLHMITVSLVFGYGAGVVSRISFRPLICTLSLLLAVVPTVVGLALHAATKADLPFHAELFTVEALVVAGTAALSLQTVHYLCRTITRSVTLRLDLTYLAKQDVLTGLANRISLRERFDEAIRDVTNADTRMALLYLDLDGFKAVNDKHGHPAGDALLRIVAKRLQSAVRAGDTVARLGGDEFVVLQRGIAHPSEAELLARRILRSVSSPYQIDGEIMRISVSIGIAIAPDQGRDLEHLSACADSALYRSKRGGKAQLSFCSPAETVSAVA